MQRKISHLFVAAAWLCGAPPPVLAQPTDSTTERGEDLTNRLEALEAEIRDLRHRLDENTTAGERRLQKLEEEREQDELEALLAEAEAEADAPDTESPPEEREFLWGALALQKLNPEMSVSVDVVAGLLINPPRFYGGVDDRSGIPVREVGLHFEHVLDPYSRFKAAIAMSPHHGVEVEEVYITWFGLLDAFSLTLGRFRNNFGVLNRWHGHDLDQVDYPLALRLVLGEEGLVGSGVSLKWFMPPLIADANELTVEVVDGSNEDLFSGEYLSIPSTMVHFKSYWDLSESTYLELGLSGMHGVNNRRGVPEGDPPEIVDEPFRHTALAGVDLTLHWSPLQRAKYESLTWRSEGYYLAKEQPDGDFLHAAGAYSYLEYQLAAQWFVGARFDIALPASRSSEHLAWDAVAYVTFWQSEFVYLRLQYSYGIDIPFARADGSLGRRVENRVLFQVDFAAGPHKHEKY